MVVMEDPKMWVLVKGKIEEMESEGGREDEEERVVVSQMVDTRRQMKCR